MPLNVGLTELVLVERPWSTYAHDAAAVVPFAWLWVGPDIELNVLEPVMV